MVGSTRFRNENKLVYGVRYTCDNTVTPVYANPFTHERPNAIFYVYSLALKGGDSHDLYALNNI